MVTKEQLGVLKSTDFLRLGQNISHGNWNGAGMTLVRLQKNCSEVGLDSFDRNFVSLKQCIIRKETTNAKDVMAIVTNKRVALINGAGKAEESVQIAKKSDQS